jgi:hypothetical protein
MLYHCISFGKFITFWTMLLAFASVVTPKAIAVWSELKREVLRKV